MACGANVPFVDDKDFFGSTTEHTDSRIALIPDFIANCGMAKVFAYLMEFESEASDVAIFRDISKTIRRALKNIRESEINPGGLSTKALTAAQENLMFTEPV